MQFRMHYQELEPPRARLDYSWAETALQTFRTFTNSREAREVIFQILEDGTALARLHMKWINRIDV